MHLLIRSFETFTIDLGMFRLFLFILLFLYNSSSLGKKLDDIKSHCIRIHVPK